MANTLAIGLVQMGAEPLQAEKNRARSVEAAQEAFRNGAEVVILPEMVVQGYLSDWRALAPVAEEVEGPTVAAWTGAAREAGGIVVGGFCERADAGALFNSAVVVGADGLILHYRKAHLFAEEKVAFRPGDLGFPVADLPFGSIGLCVCYDLRFVEVVRLLALRGADLICVPTAWLPGFDEEKWDADGLCPQARGALLQANLNQVYIACASQVGRYGDLEFLGSSVLADPYGYRALGPLRGDPEIAVVEVDLGDAKRAQVRGPLIAPRADRRTDLYGIWSDGEVL